MQRKTIHASRGETINVQNQWAAECEKRGTTVSSSTWTYSGAGTLGTASLATPLASVVLTPTGCGCLKNTVTLANGEVLVANREISVKTYG